jgi:hypothetical protein
MGRLKSSMNQSSHETSTAMRDVLVTDARPHPGPLPRGEGEPSTVTGQFIRLVCRRRPCGPRFYSRPKTSGDRCARQRRMILPFHEPKGGARLRRADSTAAGGASAASVLAPWSMENAHCVRLASLENGLDGVSPHRKFIVSMPSPTTDHGSPV